MDPETGELASIDDGGQLPERKVRVKPKFSDEARGAYGVAVPTKDGKRCPRFMTTYNYTKKKLVGYKKWCSLKKAEQTVPTRKRLPWLEELHWSQSVPGAIRG